MKATAFITGATSGIGKATARLLAEHHYRLIICGRRLSRLKELSDELSRLTEVTQLCFDVRNREEVEASISSLTEDFKQIDILINNAGNAHGIGPIHQGNVDDWDAMIDGNVKGLLYVSRAITPGMVSREAGHIINIGSIAGKEVYAKGNVYCASKFSVDAITQGMRIDLNPYGIKVTSINPGLVETEFSMVRFKGDAARAKSVYQDLKPLTAIDIAETILFTLTRPAHVNLCDITILPTDQATATIANRKVKK